MSSYPPLDNRRQKEGALAPYLRAIQAHKLVFIAVVVATIAAAGLWIGTSSKEYEATARVLISPLPQESFLGLELLRESGDPTRTAQTAAALLETQQSAEAASKKLGESRSANEILAAVSVTAEGESNVLDIKATGESPTEAVEIATAFTDSALKTRETTLQKQVGEAIEQLEDEPRTPQTPNKIAQLRTLERQGDPTMTLASPAQASDSPIGPSAPLVIVLALIAGLALATGTVVLLEMAARKVRDEDEALGLYPLPVLVRVPILPRSSRRDRRLTHNVPPMLREPYRTLLAQFQHDGVGKTVMFTSASTGDGKTTASINMATTTALAGHPTILIDLDLRKPGIDELLEVDSRAEILRLLDPATPLEGMLTPVPWMPNLSVLSPVGYGSGQNEPLTERLFNQMEALIEEACQLADFVIIDTAPLGEVSDALRVVRYVDESIVVVRPGNTNRANFEVMRDLLERGADRPTGLLVMGDRTGASSTYYAYGLERERVVPPEAKPVTRKKPSGKRR